MAVDYDKHCQLCPLHVDAERVCTPAVVHGPTPRVLIVNARPVMGEGAARLLVESLDKIGGIDQQDVAVSSTVKCVTDSDAKLKRADLKVCSGTYLMEELDTLKPEAVLLLGNEPMQMVAGKSGILKYHGNVWHMEVAPNHTAMVMPVMHPAAIMRNPRWASDFGMDIARFGRALRGEETNPKTKVVIVNDKAKLRWLVEHLESAVTLTWDIETETRQVDKPYVRTNFQDWHGEDSMIASIGFTWREGLSAVVPLWHPGSKWRDPARVLRFLGQYLQREGVSYVTHNGKFDARWLASKGIDVPQSFDTMLAAHLLDENRQKGLKPLSQGILGVDAYDVGEELKQATAMPVRKLCIYNGKDTDYTHRLAKVFDRQLAGDDRLSLIYHKLMLPASKTLTDMEGVGVWIDPARWHHAHDVALEKRETLDEWVQRQVPRELRPLNLQSPQQLGRYLFEHLALPITEVTPTGAPSTNGSVLNQLSRTHKVAGAIVKHRKWAKYLNTYLLPWWYEHKDVAGRIHSNYNLAGTVTGRLSGKGGIQQCPRDPLIRTIVGAEPGWTLVSADFSQIELRVAAMAANEKRMLRQFANGEDLHTIRAQKITGRLDVTKDERSNAKPVSFGFIYGMGVSKFVTYAYDEYGAEYTEEEAKQVREGFFADYPDLRTWHDRQRRLANRYHRVVSPLGRVRNLTDILSSDEGVRSEAERQAINSPVQSFASDLMLIALNRIHAYMRPDRGRLIATIHDSLLAEVRTKYVDRYCHFIKQTMEDTRYVERVFGTDVTVPIVADVEVGTHWGETVAWAA